jgi:hypothetical protein
MRVCFVPVVGVIAPARGDTVIVYVVTEGDSLEDTIKGIYASREAAQRACPVPHGIEWELQQDGCWRWRVLNNGPEHHGPARYKRVVIIIPYEVLE